MSTLNLLRRIFFGLTLTALLFGFQNCSDAPVATKGSDGIKADGDGGENDNQPPPEEEPPKEDPPKEDPPKEDPPKDPPKFSGKGWYVEVGKNGNGSEANPFGRIQQALDAAQAGDGVIISPGVYLESLRTMNQGDAKKPILIFAEKGRGSVEVRAKGRVLNVRHAHQHFLGLVFSGEYGDSDAVRVYTEADGWRLENSEVKESGRDCIDMGAPMDVTITHSLIHHCLNPSGGRTDAHGIVGASVKNLLIKDTEVHTFSGDAFQVDPGRTSPGWNNVVIDGCKFWLEPLPAATNGFAKGVVPGENAVDTKVRSGQRPKLTIKNSEFWGFKGGLISNMSALNLKESIVATVDAVTIYDSEIAFRLRYPAQVDITNAIVHSSEKAVRYEDGIEWVRMWNTTFGSNVATAFQNASSKSTKFDVQNFLILGSSLPSQAAGSTNLAIDSSGFENAKAHDYRVKAASAIDSGKDLGLATDRYGNPRLKGLGVDLGAIESK